MCEIKGVNERWEHLVEQGICFLLLLDELLGSLGDDVLQVGSVFLQHRDHVVHDVDVPADRCETLVSTFVVAFWFRDSEDPM